MSSEIVIYLVKRQKCWDKIKIKKQFQKNPRNTQFTIKCQNHQTSHVHTRMNPISLTNNKLFKEKIWTAYNLSKQSDKNQRAASQVLFPKQKMNRELKLRVVVNSTHLHADVPELSVQAAQAVHWWAAGRKTHTHTSREVRELPRFPRRSWSQVSVIHRHKEGQEWIIDEKLKRFKTGCGFRWTCVCVCVC